ncbi:MAG: YebC/PmpR family DNA-binding transcriptional regulator, partial [Clostridia bacterium]|nr:YebC/PmpR family DNA-binding transcriptional regulator [Clostridia bacterium]
LLIAVKQGGPDPAGNAKLKEVIAKCKANNMPNDTINNAIKKASGEGSNANYEEITYEGYGTNGVAVIVKANTDNRNRTAADVRHLFDKFNGSLGTSGSVTYMFDYKGMIVLSKREKNNEDDVMMVALDNGADDVVTSEECFEITCAPDLIHTISKAFEEAGYEVVSSEVEYLPQNMIALDKDSAISVNKLIVSLEDLDDVQNVYTNADLSVLDE